MFFWNSLAFSMIQRMLAIWSLVPLPFLKPSWTSGSSRFSYCWSLVWPVQFSHSVVSDSLRLHGLQHSRLPCPSPTPGVYSNSCPFSWWCHPAISSSVIPISSRLQSFPALVFSNESVLHIRWPKYCSFSFNISSSNEHSGLISFSMEWLDLLAV